MRLAHAGYVGHVGVGIGEHGIYLADVLHARAVGRAGGGLLHAVEPLLLKTAHEGQGLPAELRDHEDVVAGDVAAGVAVALHEDDLFAARAGGGDGGAVAGGARSDDEHVAFGVDFYVDGGFSNPNDQPLWQTKGKDGICCQDNQLQNSIRR